MKSFFILLYLVLGISTNSWSESAGLSTSTQRSFFIGTHYYGLAEYSWPINYLNSIKKDSIEGDLRRIKGMGFDTIILLASWSEFEPTIGRADEDVYRKLNLIIKVSRNLGLKVMIRIPYLWSLEGLETRERIAYALIDEGAYRISLLKFLREFDKKVVRSHENIVMKFGSWEDFYVLRDFFFSGEQLISERVRQTFSRDTGIDANSVQKNGNNYDKLMNWMDSRIRELTKEIGDYGYEIRTDADPFTLDEKREWHSHGNFYRNEANGGLIAYWAPYFGQLNTGELINSDKAIKSFSWMLDSIAARTSQTPFIDQLNFYDNSPGTENNAKILENEYKPFFEKLSLVIAERTAGYALWTIRDYSHNIVFNPAFSDGLKGWKGRNVILNADGLTISRGGYLAQDIRSQRFRVLKEKSPTLVVKIVSGDAEVEIESIGRFDLLGPGRHEIPISSLPGGDVRITLRPKSPLGDDPHIQWVGLYGHTQYGKVLDRFGNQSDFWELIRHFNGKVAKYATQKCRGFTHLPASKQYLARGVFPDGWSGTQIELCAMEETPALGFRFVYRNPSSKKRVIKVNANGIKETMVPMNLGVGEINVCPPPGSVIDLSVISVFPPFIPNIENKPSLDIRNLGVFLEKVEPIECKQKVGIW